jgi:hypothetical protein
VGEAAVPDFLVANLGVHPLSVCIVSQNSQSPTHKFLNIYRYGTFLVNNLVSPPPCCPKPSTIDAPGDEEEAEGLLSASLEDTAVLPADLGQSGYDVTPQGQQTHAR